MKHLITAALIFIIGTHVYGQSIGQHDTVDVYVPMTEHAGLKSIRIPVDFNKSSLLEKIPRDVKSQTIQQIDLVYTTYKESGDFNQISLNKSRINALRSAWSETNNDRIQWRIIGQNQAKKNNEARSLFHGFVVYYRPEPTKESIAAEIDAIDDFLERSSATLESYAGSAKTYATDTSVSVSEVVLIEEMESVDESCFDVISGKRLCTDKEFLQFMDSVNLSNPLATGEWSWTYPGNPKGYAKQKGVYTYNYWVRKDSAGCETSLGMFTYSNLFDAKEYGVVQATFERNPHWKKTLVVMDVTGSMSPYIAQTMAWVKATQSNSQVAAFTYFNDGDSKEHHLKRVGSVGGIYSTLNNSFDEVYSTLKSTMRKGGGGDCPENNVEATLAAIQKFPDLKEIVMVADNLATPRDLSLIKDVETPVHIILCGANYGVNVQYIQLAVDTKGSVHTIEEDLNARDIEPGKQFKLGNQYFTMVNGKIVRAANRY